MHKILFLDQQGDSRGAISQKLGIFQQLKADRQTGRLKFKVYPLMVNSKQSETQKSRETLTELEGLIQGMTDIITRSKEGPKLYMRKGLITRSIGTPGENRTAVNNQGNATRGSKSKYKTQVTTKVKQKVRTIIKQGNKGT